MKKIIYFYSINKHPFDLPTTILYIISRSFNAHHFEYIYYVTYNNKKFQQTLRNVSFEALHSHGSPCTFSITLHFVAFRVAVVFVFMSAKRKCSTCAYCFNTKWRQWQKWQKWTAKRSRPESPKCTICAIHPSGRPPDGPSQTSTEAKMSLRTK